MIRLVCPVMVNNAQQFVKFSIQAREKYCQSLFDFYLYFNSLGAKSGGRGSLVSAVPETPVFQNPSHA